MKVGELMSAPALWVGANETAEIAARTMTQYNIGALPVCAADGRLCGLVTDRDLVTRCMASGKPASSTRVRDVMTTQPAWVSPDTDVSVAAHLMGRRQIRRLPVVEEGKLRGMISLADLARWEETAQDASDVLENVSENIR